MPTASRLAKLSVMAAVLLGALGAGPISAQVQRSGGGASTQLYQDYQQALAERSQLKADNAKLKNDLKDAKGQLAAAKQQLVAAKTGTATTQTALTAAQVAQADTAKSLETLRGQAQQLVSRFRDTIEQLKGVELERTQLQHELTQSRAAFDQCALTNYQLYQVDNEVLDRYAHQGAFSYMARGEPFTRIERARIDNLVLEYRERADSLRIAPRGGLPAAGTPSPATPGNAAPAPARAPPTAPPSNTPSGQSQTQNH